MGYGNAGMDRDRHPLACTRAAAGVRRAGQARRPLFGLVFQNGGTSPAMMQP